ncbi:MAG: LytTR family DNA-binding domain-containing protein, partial [Bacteroidota bacterium]
MKSYIEDSPSLHLVQVLGNALEAIPLLKSEKIDLIFLDIHLPKLNGLHFLRSLPFPPKVIITSAYPDYALDGFELDVLDYLLKPFSFERFLKAVNKYPVPSPGISKPKNPAEGIAEHIFIKNGKSFQRVLLDEILYFESDADFVKIYIPEKFYMELQSLKHYASILPDHFLRIHKSYLVNLRKVEAVEGNQVVIEKKKLPVG